VLGRDGGRADDDFGPIRLEHVTLVLAHLVRADEHAAVSLLLRDESEADSGISTGRLHDRAARADLAGLLGVLDHSERDPVFHGTTRVEVLDLGQHGRR
jgi:hypothetical protein